MVHTSTKLIRVDENVFEELHALAGKLQMREGRRVSVNGALRSLLFSKNERSFLEKTIAKDATTAEKTAEKQAEIHSGTNQKKGVFASKKTRKASKKGGGPSGGEAGEGAGEGVVSLDPMKRFSLKHRKFVAE